MLIIGINGSPNTNGNTKVLLKEALEAVEGLGAETRIIDVAKLLQKSKQPFCNVCSNPCNGSCYKGTEIEEAFELIKKADGFVIGSPSYFGTVSAQLKAFFDKSRLLRGEKALYNKVGGAVTVGAARFGGQETTIKAIHDIMLVQGMLIVGDGYHEDDCGHHGACAQRFAQEDSNALNRARILGKRVFEVANKLKG